MFNIRFWTRMLYGSAIAAISLCAADASAQLTDVTQTTPNVPGGAVGKSLAQQVGAGQGNVNTPGSSVFLIKRDPARSVRRGRQLFQRKFTENQGQGPRVNNDSTGNIRVNRALGAGLVDSCAGCHGRPRGSAGFGGDVVTRPDSRDAPHLFGLGLIEQLADEMTRDLRRIEAQAVADATCRTLPASCEPQGLSGLLCELIGLFCPPECNSTSSTIGGCSPHNVTRQLTTKGVSFGSITALANGSVNTNAVVGVDPDLRVKPFFAQGQTISMREFLVGAFKAEMGLEAVDPILCAATSPAGATKVTSPAGFVFDPELDVFERPPTCDRQADPDGDGVTNEIDAALVDHMEFYLLNYFKPGRGASNSRTDSGLSLMRSIGCTNCHIQNLTINKDRRVADVETAFNTQRGIFNRLFATASTLFTSFNDGAAFPLLLPNQQSFVVRNIFTDLKRHDLGPNFHEREYDGTLQRQFVTEALWGAGSTSPYGHDGRSINLEEVIRRHGGEAQSARNRFTQLSSDNRNRIFEFLGTLILFPPDDTASNLNPGTPGTQNPQDPAQHGSINLGALFQIPAEGAE